MRTQFAITEPVTAIITLPIAGEGSEQCSGPLVIGYYAGGGGEIYIEQDGARVQILAEHYKVFADELKRAHKIAVELAQQEQT